jgi:hypothetical protein
MKIIKPGKDVYLVTFVKIFRNLLPGTDVTLVKAKPFGSIQQLNKEDDKAEDQLNYEVLGYQYLFGKDWADISYISQLDPIFFANLAMLEVKYGNREDFLMSFCQIHICYDTTFPLIEYVSQSISIGHYEGHGCNPYGYGTLANGKKFQCSVGRQSKFYKEHKGTNFTLDTLYFGSRKTNAFSVAIYNKKKEMLKKFSDISFSNSRVEIRINMPLMKKEDSENYLSYLKQMPWWFQTPQAEYKSGYIKMKNIMV